MNVFYNKRAEKIRNFVLSVTPDVPKDILEIIVARRIKEEKKMSLSDYITMEQRRLNNSGIRDDDWWGPRKKK